MRIEGELVDGLSHYEVILLQLAAPSELLLRPARIASSFFLRKRRPTVLLFSKDFSAWAWTLGLVAEHLWEEEPTAIVNLRKRIVSELPSVFERAAIDQRIKWPDVGWAQYISPESSFEPSWRGMPFIEEMWWESSGLASVRRSTIERSKELGARLGIPPVSEGSVLRLGAQAGAATSLQLQKRGLLYDPDVVLLGSIGLVVVGLVPTQFNIRSRNGERLVTDVRAKLWNYRKVRHLETGEEEWSFHFELVQLVESFVTAFREAWKRTQEVRQKEPPP